MASRKLVREVKLQGAIGPVVLACLSPDGKTVAALNQKKLSFWEVNSGKQIKNIENQPENAVYLRFSPDGKILAVGSWDEKVTLWEWQQKKERRIPLPARKLGIDTTFHGWFSPDGKWFVAGGGWDSPLCVYELATGREVRRFDCSASISTISPDGKRLAVAGLKNDKGGGETVLRFFDLESGKATTQYPLSDQHFYHSLAFSPDGKLLACGGSDRSCLVECASGRIVHRLSGGGPTKMTFFPGGKILAASTGRRLRLWDVATGREEEDRTGDFGAFPVLAISPNGRLLAASEAGDPAVSLWDTATGRLLRALSLKRENRDLQSLAFSADGGTLLAGQIKGSLQFWNVATGKEQRGVSLRDPKRPNPRSVHIRQFHVSDDGKCVSTWEEFGLRNASMRLGLWDMDSGKLLSQHVLPPRLLPPYFIMESAWSADGTTVTVRQNDGLTQIRLGTGAVRFRIEGTSHVHALAASPDDRLLAAARPAEAKDKAAVGLWEAATGKDIATVATGPVSHLALAPDDRHLVAADHDLLRIWDLATGKEQKRWPLPEANTHIGGGTVVTRLLLSPDGCRAFTVFNDGTALVWDLQPALRRGKPLTGKPSDKELAGWWTDLLADDARRAYAAIWQLSDSPQSAVAFLRQRLKPAADADNNEIRRLIAQLDSDDFATREKAFEQLAKLGPSGEAVLRHALEQKPTLEARHRMQLLLEKIDQQPVAGESLRLLRTLQVLENTGAEGKRLLRELARGAEGASLTREAQAVLRRLNRRSP